MGGWLPPCAWCGCGGVDWRGRRCQLGTCRLMGAGGPGRGQARGTRAPMHRSIAPRGGVAGGWVASVCAPLDWDGRASCWGPASARRSTGMGARRAGGASGRSSKACCCSSSCSRAGMAHHPRHLYLGGRTGRSKTSNAAGSCCGSGSSACCCGREGAGMPTRLEAREESKGRHRQWQQQRSSGLTPIVQRSAFSSLLRAPSPGVGLAFLYYSVRSSVARRESSFLQVERRAAAATSNKASPHDRLIELKRQTSLARD